MLLFFFFISLEVFYNYTALNHLNKKFITFFLRCLFYTFFTLVLKISLLQDQTKTRLIYLPFKNDVQNLLQNRGHHGDQGRSEPSFQSQQGRALLLDKVSQLELGKVWGQELGTWRDKELCTEPWLGRERVCVPWRELVYELLLDTAWVPQLGTALAPEPRTGPWPGRAHALWPCMELGEVQDKVPETKWHVIIVGFGKGWERTYLLDDCFDFVMSQF